VSTRRCIFGNRVSLSQLERRDFATALHFALDSFAAFISRGAVVRICLMWL